MNNQEFQISEILTELNKLDKYVETLVLMSDRLDTLFKAVEVIQKHVIKEKLKDEILKKRINIPLVKCKFSIRTYRTLTEHGFSYLDELKDMSDADLLRLRNVGRKTLMEIREHLKLFEENHPSVNYSLYSKTYEE